MVLLWLMVLGFTQGAELPERVDLDWSPKILLTRGPYGFSRHPMYLAEGALWLGWAILYGSAAVSIGFLGVCIAASVLEPREERALEAKCGEASGSTRPRSRGGWHAPALSPTDGTIDEDDPFGSPEAKRARLRRAHERLA